MLRTVVYDGVVMSPHPSAWLLHGTKDHKRIPFISCSGDCAGCVAIFFEPLSFVSQEDVG